MTALVAAMLSVLIASFVAFAVLVNFAEAVIRPGRIATAEPGRRPKPAS